MSTTEDTRTRLLAAAMRLLEAEGPEALQARKLTAEIGVSTMAVYTHFGGMPGLVEAIVREGLARFAAHVREATPETDDPMADLFAGGMAYLEFAFRNSQLYRLMFGLTGSARLRGFGLTGGSAEIWDMPEGIDAFSVLLTAVQRVIDAGLVRQQDAREAAAQILSVTHGEVLLAIGGFIQEEMERVIRPLTVNLMVGLGAERKRTERSLARALNARARAAAH